MVYESTVSERSSSTQLSLLNSKKLTDLQSNAKEWVPQQFHTQHEPMSCPAIAGGSFQWPQNGGDDAPPGFGHHSRSLSFDYEMQFSEQIQNQQEHPNRVLHNIHEAEEVDVAKIHSDLAALMIDEDGEVVNLAATNSGDETEDSAIDEEETHFHGGELQVPNDLPDFASDEYSSSAFSSASSSACSSSASSASTSPVSQTRRLVAQASWSEIATPKKTTTTNTETDASSSSDGTSSSSDGGASSSSDEQDSALRAASQRKPTPRKRLGSRTNSNRTPASHRRSRSKKFTYKTASYTPFPTPNVTPSANPSITPSATPRFPTPSHASSSATPIATPLATPKLATLPASYTSPPLDPLSYKSPSSTGESGIDLSTDDVNQLRSLHNLARLGSYEDFEQQVVRWLHGRKATSNCHSEDPSFEADNAHILRHLQI